MPRPKGCRCPRACPVHPDKVPTIAEAEPPDFSDIEEMVRKAAAEQAGKEPPKDPKPGQVKRTRSTKKSSEPTSQQLEEALAELLVLPAIPAKAWWHCDFCMQHFLSEGPVAAKELVELSEQNPALRRALVRLHEVIQWLTWGSALGLYVGKPALHHLAPEPLLAAVGPVMKIPPRPEPEHSHNMNGHNAPESSPTPAEAGGATGPTPPPGPTTP